MFKTNFTNEQGDRITYNAEGDPEFAYYTIENLVFNETEQKFEFVQVSNTVFSLFNRKLHGGEHFQEANVIIMTTV